MPAAMLMPAYQTSGTLNPPPFPLPPDPQQPTSDYSSTEYVCNTCGIKGWHSSSALRRHKKYHLDDNLKSNDCLVCGKSFSQKTALKTHANIHAGRRPHKCRKGCSQNFSDPSSRGRHENELHNPAHGWKCLEIGCSEIFKRKSAYKQHMENVHYWPRDEQLPDATYAAAKDKCANDYAEHCRALDAGNAEEELDTINSEEVKPLFNGKRLRSGSTSSNDHLGPPPTKKQALEPSISRRNAVGTIEMPVPQLFTPSHVGHKHSESDELSTSTASSLVETFSGAYRSASHGITNGSPLSRPVSSDEVYHKAVGRVATPTYTFQGASAPSLLYPGDSGYSMAPDDNSPRAHAATPEDFYYQYSNSVTDAPVRSSWNSNSYGSQWSLGNEVAQTPHGVSPPIAHNGRSACGMLASSRSGLLHGASNSGIHMSTGQYQIEHSSSSPAIDPRLDHAGGSFGDHRALARPSGEHTHSPRQDSQISRSMYMLDRPAYHSYPQQMPRIVPSGSDQERSYS
ncbi:hypothetical protein B0J17DRAFT_712488 [Rhizoctonia solani]|nr:hypothetical protein B0J17DRAFT_712488 [Rhizoctonia solani]